MLMFDDYTPPQGLEPHYAFLYAAATHAEKNPSLLRPVFGWLEMMKLRDTLRQQRTPCLESLRDKGFCDLSAIPFGQDTLTIYFTQGCFKITRAPNKGTIKHILPPDVQELYPQPAKVMPQPSPCAP